jgi:nucleoporin POM34
MGGLEGELGAVGTPTKSGKASVGLNSKWLYEKGRGSPRASFGAGLEGWGGGGSVFN